MAREIIGIGASANDGTGDPLRTAFDKSNSNFSELYAQDHPGFIASNWHYLTEPGVVLSGGGLVNNTILMQAVHLQSRVTLSDLGAFIVTPLADRLFKLAIYDSHATTKLPTGLPRAETGDISTASANTVTADIVGANVTFESGLYWIAAWANGNGALLRQISQNNFGTANRFLGSTTANNILNGSLTLQREVTWGASWPTMTSASFVEVAGGNRLFSIIGRAA